MHTRKEKIQCEKSSPHIITETNNVSTNVNHLKPKMVQNLHGNGVYSGRLQRKQYSVDKIIKKYEEERLIKTCNKNNNQIVKNNESVVAFKERNKNVEFCAPTSLTSREKVCADKTTYCRPVISLYNEEFIHRTMERNSKLKKLVKSLAIARQREKENVSWNNYINKLKNKHGPTCNDSKWTRAPQLESEQYITPDIIDDCYNTRFSWQQSNPCRNLLQDLYEEYNDPLLPTRIYTDRPSQSNCSSLPHNNNSYCYLTSSQGRLIALERERQKNEYLNRWYSHSSNNYLKFIKNHENKNKSKKNLPGQQSLRDGYSFKPNNGTNCTQNCIENAANQTDHYFQENISKNKATNKTESVVQIHESVQAFENNKIIEEKLQDVRNNMTTVSLVNVETKLSTLIDCINNFINEIKLERKIKRETKAVSATCQFADQNMNTMKSGTVEEYDKVRTDNIVCGGIFNDTSDSTLGVSNFYPCAIPNRSEIADIMKEIDKFCSKDRLYKSQPCSVNITFEVPTRDCCTEVTKSLSKQKLDSKEEEIEEVSTETAALPQMTIAVNTDPLNFLSLIRISIEALMHLLSNVPTINYQSYLAFLPFPQTTRRIESHYTCNICGAAFTKPSALSDHIQVHNLGKTRDCCVCRHVLDQMCMCSTPGRLFACRYCGQRFARAYCCELHQRGCAGARGHIHDVSSSLMMLS